MNSTKGTSVAHYDMRFAKPLDTDILDRIFSDENMTKVMTIEDGALAGGFGEAILTYKNNRWPNSKVEIKTVGIPDKFITHGNVDELFAECGITTNVVSEYFAI